MKAVSEIKDQFTLADVLPSSLECSERSVCSHHSQSYISQSRENSRQHIPAQSHNSSNINNRDKTVNDEAMEDAEAINDAAL